MAVGEHGSPTGRDGENRWLSSRQQSPLRSAPKQARSAGDQLVANPDYLGFSHIRLQVRSSGIV